MYQIRQNRLVGLKLEQLGGDIPLIERSSYDAGMCDPDWDYSPRGEIRQSGKQTTLHNVLREIHDETLLLIQKETIQSVYLRDWLICKP